MYRGASSRTRSFILLLSAAAVTVAAACGGGGADEKATAEALPVCAVPADSIIGAALERFIRTRNPVPHRFLLPLGTDSVVPDGAQYPLNLFGRASFVWPSDPALQQQQIGNMRARGSWITVVLYYHGIDTVANGRFNVTFSGRYIDRANDGINLLRTGVMYDCFATGNRRVLTEDEPPPPPDDTGAAPGRDAGGAPGGI